MKSHQAVASSWVDSPLDGLFDLLLPFAQPGPRQLRYLLAAFEKGFNGERRWKSM